MTTADASCWGDLFQQLFNANPLITFVVDDDVRIVEHNSAAATLFAGEKRTVIKKRGGDALDCLHSRETSGGCGRAPFCKDCIIRNAVKEAFLGNHVFRSKHRMELLRNENIQEIYALVTVSPFVFGGNRLALLILEDIGEIVELKRLLPVCCVCKRIRNDQEYWVRMESYFHQHLDIDFTHSYCPSCSKKAMDEIDMTLSKLPSRS
ncbi:MAG: PAS domain-containing protein [Fibrobacterota bacterium]